MYLRETIIKHKITEYSILYSTLEVRITMSNINNKAWWNWSLGTN